MSPDRHALGARDELTVRGAGEGALSLHTEVHAHSGGLGEQDLFVVVRPMLTSARVVFGVRMLTIESGGAARRIRWCLVLCTRVRKHAFGMEMG